MKPDLDRVIDQVLARYSEVDLPPGLQARWEASRLRPAPRHRRTQWMTVSAAAWLALAVALLLILGLGWYRARQRAQTRARLAQHERTVLVPLPPSQQAPLTPEQQQLIQLLQTDPAALATKKPAPLPPPAVKHP